MELRINHRAAQPEVLKKMLQLEQFMKECGLEHSLEPDCNLDKDVSS